MAVPSIKRTLWTVGLSLVGSVALGGIIVAMVLFFSEAMRDVTHRFLGAVRMGRPDLAYAMTSARLQARVPAAAFPAYLERAAPNVRASTSEWINGFAGGSGEECMDVWLTMSSSALPSSVYLILISENGQWRVDEITMSEPAMCDTD